MTMDVERFGSFAFVGVSKPWRESNRWPANVLPITEKSQIRLTAAFLAPDHRRSIRQHHCEPGFTSTLLRFLLTGH
jgi:hypothetical protein